LISNFRRVLYVVCFLLGNCPASEFYMPTFRNTICSIFIGKKVNKFTFLLMKMEQIECSETSAYKIQTPGDYPEENIQYMKPVLNYTKPVLNYMKRVLNYMKRVLNYMKRVLNYLKPVLNYMKPVLNFL
jgi:hypothetical protein